MQAERDPKCRTEARCEVQQPGCLKEREPDPDGGDADGEGAYLDKMIKNMHNKLSIMGNDSGRNTAVYNAALKIGSFIAGAGLNEARATAMLLDACNHNGLITEDGEKSVMASIRSGSATARPNRVRCQNPKGKITSHSKMTCLPMTRIKIRSPSVVISLCPAATSFSTPTRRQFHYGVKMIKSGGPMVRA